MLKELDLEVYDSMIADNNKESEPLMPKTLEEFQIEKSLRFGSGSAYFHPKNSEVGNKEITNDIEIRNQPSQSYCKTLENILTLGNSTGPFKKRSSC